MSDPQGLPESVLRFIEGHIDSVPQLEALLILRADPGRDWSAAELAARLYTSDTFALEALERLRRQGLVAAGPSHRYQFQPASEELRQGVAELAGAYATHLTRIATLIHCRPSSSVTEFARAFDLKKDR
jgi:hypothetical protein